jgi:hypothetical protein
MQSCMREQRSIKLRPHEATAKRDSMLFLALARTHAVFTGIGFSNPNRVWAQALKDDRGTGALSAAEPASEASPGYAPPAGGKRPAPEALPTADQSDPCPRECPNGS